jgi:hypothetical protein
MSGKGEWNLRAGSGDLGFYQPGRVDGFAVVKFERAERKRLEAEVERRALAHGAAPFGELIPEVVVDLAADDALVQPADILCRLETNGGALELALTREGAGKADSSAAVQRLALAVVRSTAAAATTTASDAAAAAPPSPPPLAWLRDVLVRSGVDMRKALLLAAAMIGARLWLPTLPLSKWKGVTLLRRADTTQPASDGDPVDATVVNDVMLRIVIEGLLVQHIASHRDLVDARAAVEAVGSVAKLPRSGVVVGAARQHIAP